MEVQKIDVLPGSDKTGAFVSLTKYLPVTHHRNISGFQNSTSPISESKF